MSVFRQPPGAIGSKMRFVSTAPTPTANPSLDDEACWAAVASRDRRFAGRFVLAVKTTGVYCRPGCPAPLPKRRNTAFYLVPSAAEDDGFRPCLRCRPETAPGTPAWRGTSAVVSRALKRLQDDPSASAEALADGLGVGERHLRRLFLEHLGTTPGAVARTGRLHFARRLLDESALPMSEVAFASGFGSVRQFNDAMKRTFGRPPGDLRRQGRSAAAAGPLTLRLPYRTPFDWNALLGFFGARAIPGVESVADGVYRRTVRLPDGAAILRVADDAARSALVLETDGATTRHLLEIAARVARQFDLSADPGPIAAHLARDPFLEPLVARRPGLRVPGAYDPFETSVRAILGQQVSVSAATTLSGRLVARFGEPLPGGPREGLTHLFPEPRALAGRAWPSAGLPQARVDAIRAFARAVDSGALALGTPRSLDDAIAALTALPGVGPWTAHVIAMRALGEPDAFPVGDLGLRKALGTADAESRTASWRPWRAYAALHLWTSLATGG